MEVTQMNNNIFNTELTEVLHREPRRGRSKSKALRNSVNPQWPLCKK